MPAQVRGRGHPSARVGGRQVGEHPGPSVTPYPASTRTPGPNTSTARAAAPARHTSVVTTSNRNPPTAPRPPATYPASASAYRGAHSMAPMPRSSRAPAQSATESCNPGSPSTSVPPDPSARTTSPVNTSKLTLASDSHRYRSAPKCAAAHPANTAPSPSWVTSVPFGTPVDPDV